MLLLNVFHILFWDVLNFVMKVKICQSEGSNWRILSPKVNREDEKALGLKLGLPKIRESNEHEWCRQSVECSLTIDIGHYQHFNNFIFIFLLPFIFKNISSFNCSLFKIFLQWTSYLNLNNKKVRQRSKKIKYKANYLISMLKKD